MTSNNIMSCSSFRFTSQVVQHDGLNQPVKCQENKKTVTRETINSATIELGGEVLPNSINLLLNLASCPAKMDFEVGKSDKFQQLIKHVLNTLLSKLVPLYTVLTFARGMRQWPKAHIGKLTSNLPSQPCQLPP